MPEEEVRLRENNPYSLGYVFLFDEGDSLLLRDPVDIPKSINDRYYTVENEEDLWSIAHKAYGDSKWWWLIRDANEIPFAFDLQAGKTLIIPDLETAKASF